MKTSITLTSKEPSGKKNQKTITDVNPSADGNALKTFAQGLNNLTTNTYIGSTKINIDNLLEEDSGGGGGNVNPLPAPNIVAFYWGAEDEEEPTQVHTFTVTNAATSFTPGTIGWYAIGIATDSTGNLNVTGTPAKSAAYIAKFSNITDFMEAVGSGNSGATPPAEITAIQNPTYWLLNVALPDPTDADCKGAFTLVLNATETYSSVTITINVSEIIN